MSKKAGWIVAGACVWAMGCASTAAPAPRDGTRPLRPGAEVAQEVGVATEGLLESEGQARVRYASSMNPEDAPVVKSAESKGEDKGEPGDKPEGASKDDVPNEVSKDAPEPDTTGEAPEAP